MSSPEHYALKDAYQAALLLLDRNTKPGYPCQEDTGECYFCDKGQPRKHDDGEEWCYDDDIDHLESPAGHKDDCAWKNARDFLNKMGFEEVK